MAEIVLGVLIGQCLTQHIADKAVLTSEATTWQDHHNAKVVKVDWRFTAADARIKLKTSTL